jgi:hypothetical protein
MTHTLVLQTVTVCVAFSTFHMSWFELKVFAICHVFFRTVFTRHRKNLKGIY